VLYRDVLLLAGWLHAAGYLQPVGFSEWLCGLLRLLGFSDLICRNDERAIKIFIEIFRDF
jgi:hypothetical protein